MFIPGRAEEDEGSSFAQFINLTFRRQPESFMVAYVWDLERVEVREKTRQTRFELIIQVCTGMGEPTGVIGIPS